MATDRQMMTFSFLTSGPTFTVEIPTGLQSVPELESPLVSGIGPRAFVFTPDPEGQLLSEGMSREGELLRTLTGPGGRVVQLYRRLDPPLTWWLHWRLSGGVLTTHLREYDGVDRVDGLVENLSVVEDGPTPFLLLSGSLRRGVNGVPGYQERASVWTADTDLTVTFLRPGFVSPGRVTASRSGGRIHLRAGAIGGMEMQVSAASAEEARETLDLGLETLL
jgi:hypothetical protein